MFKALPLTLCLILLKRRGEVVRVTPSTQKKTNQGKPAVESHSVSWPKKIYSAAVVIQNGDGIFSLAFPTCMLRDQSNSAKGWGENKTYSKNHSLKSNYPWRKGLAIEGNFLDARSPF